MMTRTRAMAPRIPRVLVVLTFLVTMLALLTEVTAFIPSNANVNVNANVNINININIKTVKYYTSRPDIQPVKGIITHTGTTCRQSSTQRHGTTTSASSTTDATRTWDEQQLMDYAAKEGVVLSLTTLGPGYRALVRAKHNETQILGYCEGFIRPYGGVLHLDKMEVFKKVVKQTSKENPQEFRGGGTLLGVGQLMGCLCLLHGKANGCTTAEFLAIDDEEKQHRKLVQYYRRSGFKIIKYVGDSPLDIPDRLMWGGRGTLMRENVDTLLQKWTTVFEKTAKV